MLDALKALFENNAISEEIRAEIEQAWEQRIQENRLSATAELREEFAQKYEHDKATMVEAIDTMLEEKLAEELNEFADDRQKLAEARAKYAVAMRENANLMKNFVVQQLGKEIGELHEDQKAMAGKFSKLENFVVDSLSKEIAEFYEDKKDLAETKVRLVREAKEHLAKVKSKFITDATKIVAETVEKGLTKEVIFNGFRELKGVWLELKGNLRLKRYLNAFFVFSMAVQTIMLMAVYFGEKEIEWGSDSEKTTGLIISILVIQLVAIVGAILTSRASSKYGNIKTLIAVNVVWMLVCVYAYFMVTPFQFYIAAGIVGLVTGGVQSLGRSTYSKFLPETEDTTSYFSFYDVAEKIGIVIGMLIFALVDQISSMRYAILFLFIFFLVGIILLFRVPENKNV